MNGRVEPVSASNGQIARGASGREIALRFNRAVLLIGVLMLAGIWLMPV